MEFFDITDEQGIPTGEVVAREIAHRDGILHRTAHVWIVRLNHLNYEVLLQKRSMDKDSFPGLYDTSSAGHIPAGAEPIDSAIRELEEELGVQANPEDLAFAGKFRIQYEEIFHGKPFRDNEVTWVYLYQKQVDIAQLTLQESEVEEVRWFDLEEVFSEIQCSRERFCVPKEGIAVLRDYLAETGTERLIQVMRLVKEQSGQPLMTAEEYAALSADILQTTAKLRLIFPNVPEREGGSSTRARLYRALLDGWYEGLHIVDSLDYARAWQDLQENGGRAKISSYFDRWCTYELKQGVTWLAMKGAK